MTKKYFEDKCKNGSRIFKCSLAYDRVIKFENTNENKAKTEFNTLFSILTGESDKMDKIDSLISQSKNFQDYMMHIILEIASKYNVTVQFHTGIQEGNGNYLSNSDPLLLTNLFIKYPEVDFDLFHMSYPYYAEAGVLSKNFPNVFIDMCWAHIISPKASVDALLEWIDTVPINKISAFGGDYLFVDGVYGHQVMARENVSRALTIKVCESGMKMDEAREIARMLFYENPCRIFKLDLLPHQEHPCL